MLPYPRPGFSDVNSEFASTVPKIRKLKPGLCCTYAGILLSLLWTDRHIDSSRSRVCIRSTQEPHLPPFSSVRWPPDALQDYCSGSGACPRQHGMR